MQKHFNTAGPVHANQHYCIDPVSRVDWEEIDDRITQGNQEVITGSAFNIKSASLRMGSFTLTEVQALYAQHTEATGQVFDAAIFPALEGVAKRRRKSSPNPSQPLERGATPFCKGGGGQDDVST
jgi:hypothetical protein